MARKKRVLVEVYHSCGYWWIRGREGRRRFQVGHSEFTRLDAIRRAAAYCRFCRDDFGDLLELRVRRLDGTWSKETRTYGDDPRKSKG